MQVQRSAGLRSGRAPVPFQSNIRFAPFKPCRIQQPRVVCGAAASDDPYKLLGVERDADSTEIGKAYRVKKYEHRFNPEMLQKVESAHSSIMLSQLSARMKGKGVSKSVAYADQEPLFPWRPKRWDATPKVIMVIGAMQLGMVAYGFQQPALSKTIFCGLIGIVANVMKQNAILPPPKDPDMATEEEAGRASRNFVRGFLLGILATFAGTLVFSLPEVLVQQFKLTLPVIPGIPNVIVSMKILGSALFNWVITAFYY
ncbi:Coiled-coil domain-containing protein 13 [Pleodorina starrii]|uniref:Coiled-coil domain-containing protein 13 n=1 Tax=Pleodorina starrii TaxID=330485 RepID=A0A9W6BGF4_9CHLO|nr:Coiled-coil domain-containing protein 13 [Pleodorina starrii]GLC51308.1 Coiled-coil domain-containing protein 13 [Pleodorina starrii]GLC63669.1 Coiled-coil domain-containing protein 13 [Pleodorina starrii]